jgi:hypothetical protein
LPQKYYAEFGKSHPHSLTPAFDWPDILIGSDDDGAQLELSDDGSDF